MDFDFHFETSVSVVYQSYKARNIKKSTQIAVTARIAHCAVKCVRLIFLVPRNYSDFVRWEWYLCLRKFPKEQSVAMIKIFIDKMHVVALSNTVQRPLKPEDGSLF